MTKAYTWRRVAQRRSINEALRAGGAGSRPAWNQIFASILEHNFFCAIGRWLRYWLCAHWWPDLKLWIKTRIGEPLRRAFNYFCFGLVYVFCGHWIPAVKAWLDFAMAQLRRLGGYIHRTVLVFLLRKIEDFRCWLRRCLHRLAVAIRDSVLWPVCLLVVDVARELSQLMYRVLLQPVIDYFYQRYKIIETGILIYFLGPVCDTIVKNIPEKSPFCDDSDVELEGMLPDEITEDIDLAAGAAITSEGEDSIGDIELPSPLDEEERDFTTGLAFPTIHASESSDEEFDLGFRPPSTRRKRRRKDEAPSGPGAAAEELPAAELQSSPRRRQMRSPKSLDDEFELLQ
ncbi:unnamed protein product [Heligmosomoides polygyrus]|uniref:Bestrophin homolog n=1 Tax=Heligmosomoides polygyrus TaxID=6339 RepID=A0A3P8CWL1_HELPZ|nr:unnamed protein product [Heligmosomoides polygyrus]